MDVAFLIRDCVDVLCHHRYFLSPIPLFKHILNIFSGFSKAKAVLVFVTVIFELMDRV